MPQVEKIKIFLASPGDVDTERRHVMKVVEEINRTVAAALGVVLEVISSKNAFPGYGKDGQAILNEQIGNMKEYELFIGIMWNRIGTPTPRAKSGTVEEFTRAVRALTRRRKPEVWFYFRQAGANLTTKEELKQKEEVLDFRAKFRTNGLFRDYKSPAEFRDQLREHLTVWLSQRQEKVSKPRSTGTKKDTAPAKAKTKAEAATTDDRKKTATTITAKKASAKTTAVTETSSSPRKALTSKNGTTRSPKAVGDPGDWVMLDRKFFQAQSSNTQSDQSIVLCILPKNLEQTAELKALQPRETYHRRVITFANLHEAGNIQVSSVMPASAGGKTIFNITLTPNRQQSNSGWGEVNYQGYNAEKVAELRARQILLGEPLPKEIGRLAPTQITVLDSHPMMIGKGIFPELWAKLQTQPSLFLPKAWLWAAYCLKMSEVIEDVLELELGPIKNKVMPVKFQGRRRRFYANQEPILVKVVGSCTLSE
jgi:dsDNA-binding SOS-regulon protein